MDKSDNSKRLLFRITIFWIAATTVGLVLSSRITLRAFRFSDLHLGKSVLYYALVLGVALIPGIAMYWWQATTAERRFIGVMVFLLLVGQTAGESRKLFPFVEWDMYSQVIPHEPAMVVEYVGVTEDNQRIVLTPSHIVPSLGRGTLRIGNGMRNLVRGALSSDGTEEQRNAYRWRMHESLSALKRLHNQKTPSSPIKDIEVYLSHVDPRAPASPLPRSQRYSTDNSTSSTQ